MRFPSLSPIGWCVAIVAAVVPVAASPAPKVDPVAYLTTLRAADLRVATVGERLAVANVALCKKPVYRTGLLLHDSAQYAANMQAAAKGLFRFERPISVEGTVPDSPAARAAIPANSGIVAIDGAAVDDRTDPGDPFVRMDRLLARLDNAASDGTVDIAFQHEGRPGTAHVDAIRGCQSHFQIGLSNSVNAQADGRYVQIDGRMVDFVENDDELAAVLAHELAHNILEHRARLDAAGVDRGPLGGIGRNAAMIQATENEADRLSVYLMANAGFDPGAAAGFWDRLARKHGYGIFTDGTHLRRGPRVALVNRELLALAALRKGMAKGAPLIPDLVKR